jgi:hypothetical protein
VAQGDIAHGATRLGAHGDALLYAVWTGVLLVDATAPDEVARQRYSVHDGPPSLSAGVSFAGERALISSVDGGRLYAIDLSP